MQKKQFAKEKSAKNKQSASLQKKTRKSTKNKPEFAGKPQGWQY